MSRYIDADKLIQSICNTADLGGWVGDTLRNIKRLAVRYINSTPSIDIVRCSECKYNSICNRGVQHTTRDMSSVTIGYKSVDFCSYGERKASEKPTSSEKPNNSERSDE